LDEKQPTGIVARALHLVRSHLASFAYVFLGFGGLAWAIAAGREGFGMVGLLGLALGLAINLTLGELALRRARAATPRSADAAPSTIADNPGWLWVCVILGLILVAMTALFEDRANGQLLGAAWVGGGVGSLLSARRLHGWERSHAAWIVAADPGRLLQVSVLRHPSA